MRQGVPYLGIEVRELNPDAASIAQQGTVMEPNHQEQIKIHLLDLAVEI